MTAQGPKVFDDLSRLAGGALGALGGLRGEIEEMVRQRVERVATDLDLVTREDFEAVREMAAEARAENERLADRIATLEARLADSGGGGTAARKAAPRKTTAKASPKTGAKTGGKSGGA
jgi:BMFP domain-containing protein YqiC